MASIWVPCPKTVLASGVGSISHQKQSNLFPIVSNTNLSVSGLKGPSTKQFGVQKLQTQLNDVVAVKSSNSAPVADTKSKGAPPEEKDVPAEAKVPDALSISTFMTQASDLIKLVDSRDIVELELKQLDCELVIRKKEALQQQISAAPVVAMQAPYQQPMLPTSPPASSTHAAPLPALPPPPKTSASSHPALKCPMAGTFYRCPAPGEPPFVKVGDKVQKGQVICIIEAMKLMNEIEADQSGTIAEILVEDGKPVSMDVPLFVIVP
ncbi:hypothetical protein K2173_019947 [Erythroxylum novogranatense]|uniref:Biotin carboxyl carrier protein of acetyl-CoA carboxylase n=1 Tax=Erythroxylum novogranatense TaxID=1862640 RepID=A0AAV8U6R0_9ROSI|nr:hypothetical protein K2173_019947 [Erythroxylum novogranatense]